MGIGLHDSVRRPLGTPPGSRRRTWPPGAAARPPAARHVGPVETGELSVTIVHERERSVVQVSGALDAYGAPLVTALIEHARNVRGRPVVADLGGVGFCDSHGLAPLLGAGVRIEWASPRVRRLLRLLELSGPGGTAPPVSPDGGRRPGAGSDG
jgi:anti-anti-sigma factor